MSVKTTNVATVNTTATQLIDAGRRSYNAPLSVSIENEGSVDIFIGGADVTASGATKGRKVVAGGSYELDLHSGDVLYACVAAGTGGNVNVLALGS